MIKNDSWIQHIQHSPKLKKYSQTGEEGYLKYILDNIGYNNRFLVDIGAWDGYHLSNTRLFIEELGFKGLLIDGDNRGNPDVMQEWITKDNVCDILKKHNCPKEFSFLSYDTDGNDYDIIKALCSEYKPDLIICEINGTIPLGVSKKIKYNPNHVWMENDYYGFSFSAGVTTLAQEIGYRAIFQNDALNLYLIRKELMANPDAPINIEFQHNPYHPHDPNGEWVNV